MMFACFDIETFGLGGEIKAVGVYDGKTYKDFISKKTKKTANKASTTLLLKEVFSYLKTLKTKVFYAHNGGKFDFLKIMKFLASEYVIEDILLPNSSILSFSVYDKEILKYRTADGNFKGHGKIKKEDFLLFEFRDSLFLLKSSLKSLCETFGVKHNKLEYTDYNNHADENLLKAYLKNDVIGLYEIITIFCSLLDFDSPPLTISSAAMTQWLLNYGGADFIESIECPLEKESLFRSACHGGRVEVFERLCEKAYYYDFNSLYPYVMQQYPYPTGKFKKTSKFQEDLCGIYKIRYNSKEYIPFLGIKQDKFIFPNGIIESWFYTPEARYALANGGEFLKGYCWTSVTKPFNSYVDHFYKIKENQKEKNALYLIAKFMMNSLSGKFNQRRDNYKKISIGLPFKENTTVLGTDDFFLAIEKQPPKIVDWILPPIYGHVTSYARMELYSLLQYCTVHGNVYYCDTDSIITDIPPEKMPCLINNSKLGALALEHEINRGIFLLPKLYALETTKGVVYKAKGYNKNKLSWKMYEDALHGNLSAFYTEKQGIYQFLESFRCGQNLGSDKTKLRMLGDSFNKRILVDEIHTRPCLL